MIIRRAPLLRTAAVLTAAVLAGCNASERGETAVVHDTLTAVRLVTTESGLIGAVADMTVGEDQRLYLADYSLKHVLSLAPDGTDPRIIGREGSGPGEFSAPVNVSTAGDSVRVFDRTHSTVQVFSRAGSYARGFTANAPETGRGRTFTREGGFAFATDGLDSALVKLIDTEGEPVASYGSPVVAPTNVWDFGAIKSVVREGRVPDQFRNNVLPVWLDDGSIVLGFYADPEVRKYDASGRMVWTTSLVDPVLDHAFAEFVRRNVEEPNPAMIYSLSYIADALATGDEVWFLLAPSEGAPAVILSLDAETGALRRRRVVHGVTSARAFAVDEEHGRLYIANGDDASLSVAALPGT